MIRIYINNKLFFFRKKITILQALQMLYYEIPKFCYNDALSLSINCRMCLVEVIGMTKLIPACSTFISDKIKIYIASMIVKKAREILLEFILLNHPLDCPICDQGGECDLQNFSTYFGIDQGRNFYLKSSKSYLELGPLILGIMNRCIQCTRCIRFLEEVCGLFELGIFYRGNYSEINIIAPIFPFMIEFSGNLVNLCPVGALTHKPYKFSYRSFNIIKLYGIDPFDSLGLPIIGYIGNQYRINLSQVKNNLVQNSLIKIEAGFINNFNLPFISDKTRYSFEIFSSSYRLLKRCYFKNRIYFLFKKFYKKKDYLLGDLIWFNNNFFNLFIGEIQYIKFFILWRFLYIFNFSLISQITFLSFFSLQILNFLKIYYQKYLKKQSNIGVLIDNFYNFWYLEELIIFLRQRALLKNIQYNLFLYNFNMDHFLFFKCNSLLQNFDNGDLFFLIGTNPRLEAATFNLYLRKQIIQKNLKLFFLGDYINNLNYSYIHLGNQLKIFQQIIEGKHKICEFLKHAKNIFILIGQLNFKRIGDTETLMIFFFYLIKKVYLQNQNYLNLNFLHFTINSIMSCFMYVQPQIRSNLYLTNLIINKFYFLIMLNVQSSIIQFFKKLTFTLTKQNFYWLYSKKQLTYQKWINYLQLWNKIKYKKFYYNNLYSLFTVNFTTHYQKLMRGFSYLIPLLLPFENKALHLNTEGFLIQNNQFFKIFLKSKEVLSCYWNQQINKKELIINTLKKKKKLLFKISQHFNINKIKKIFFIIQLFVWKSYKQKIYNFLFLIFNDWLKIKIFFFKINKNFNSFLCKWFWIICHIKNKKFLFLIHQWNIAINFRKQKIYKIDWFYFHNKTNQLSFSWSIVKLNLNYLQFQINFYENLISRQKTLFNNEPIMQNGIMLRKLHRLYSLYNTFEIQFINSKL